MPPAMTTSASFGKSARRFPTQIKPDIKNLKNIREEWDVLDDDFCQVMENVSSLVKSLLVFRFPKNAKSESQKFIRAGQKGGTGSCHYYT